MLGQTADELDRQALRRARPSRGSSHRRRRPRRARRGRDGDAPVRGPLPAPRRADHRGERRRLGDPRRPAGGRPALHPDRGRHRCAPDDARARAVAVRDARPAGRGRRAPRRRHRPAYASGRRAVGEDRRAPRAARRPARPRPARRRPARRRQDRDPRRGARQARQADQGRVRAHEDAHHGGSADARRERVRARRHGRGDRADAPREVGRQRLPGGPGGGRDPDHRPHRRGRRRLRRAHALTAVQARVERGRRDRGDAAPVGRSTSIRRCWTRS